MFDITNNKRRKRDFFDVDNLFPDFFSNSFFNSNQNHMDIDIKETDKQYEFIIEIPGIKRENIELNVYDDVINIKVEKVEEVNEEEFNYIRKERKLGTLSRSFKIPNINKDAIKAKYQDGILTVTVPKSNIENQQVKQINID